MKETTASAKPLARPIGWRSVPTLTAELQSRGPLLGPPSGDIRRSARRRWRRAFVRGTSLPGDRSAVHIPSIRLAVPSTPGLRHAASRDYFHSPYFVSQFSLASVSCSYTTPMLFSRAPSAPDVSKEHRRHRAHSQARHGSSSSLAQRIKPLVSGAIVPEGAGNVKQELHGVLQNAHSHLQSMSARLGFCLRSCQ